MSYRKRGGAFGRHDNERIRLLRRYIGAMGSKLSKLRRWYCNGRSRLSKKTKRGAVAQRTLGPAVELCAGLGGIGIGLRALGFEVVKAYDSWASAVAVYNHNFGDEAAAKANLLTAEGRSLVEADRRTIGEIELLAAGPPCKGFSRLRNGRHDGRNGHNRVLAAMPDYVAMLRPRLFLLENVPDLIRHRRGKTIEELLARLARPARGLRYRVDYKIYDAASYGTPQVRRRILILGVREGGKEQLPQPGPDLGQLFSAVRHGSVVTSEYEPYLAALISKK